MRVSIGRPFADGDRVAGRSSGRPMRVAGDDVTPPGVPAAAVRSRRPLSFPPRVLALPARNHPAATRMGRVTSRTRHHRRRSVRRRRLVAAVVVGLVASGSVLGFVLLRDTGVERFCGRPEELRTRGNVYVDRGCDGCVPRGRGRGGSRDRGRRELPGPVASRPWRASGSAGHVADAPDLVSASRAVPGISGRSRST